MNHFNKILLIFLLVLSVTNLRAQSIEAGLKTINESSLKAQLNILAADWMEGREAGSKGEYMAGDYIASMFQVFGVEPFGDTDYMVPTKQERARGFRPEPYQSYFQKFNIIKYKFYDRQELNFIKEQNESLVKNGFKYGIDYSVSNVESDLEITAPVVFVGYGIKDEKSGYNDFSKMKVDGKIIVRLDGFPGYLDTTSVGYKKIKIENLWDQKDNWAKEAGAVGIINISRIQGRLLSQPSNLPFYFKNGEYEAESRFQQFYDYRATLASDSLDHSVPQIRLSTRVQNELLKLAMVDIFNFEQNVKNSLKPESKEITGVKISLKVGVKSELIGVRNVVGVIEGEKKDEFIVIGAHYDHIGKYNGYVYNGADDNGSGTVGVLSIARAIKASGKKPEKSILFACWTAEERGLFGSHYFVKNAPYKNKLLLNLNLDMIARNSSTDSLGNRCGFEYNKKYEGFRELADSVISKYGLDLKLKYTASDKPLGGSDYAPFSDAGLPVISLFAAMHPDYHQPGDEVSKINWKKMEQIIKLSFITTYELSKNGIQKFIYEKKAETK